MTCSRSSVSCESGCGEERAAVDGEYENRQQTSSPSCSLSRRECSDGICIKCKVNETIDAAADSSIAGDAPRFCRDCFWSNLYAKFRFAITSNAMITPSDNVLVAFSGQTSSRVALQFVHEMHQKAQQNFDASRDRSLPVFGVRVAYIDESAVYPIPTDEFDKAIDMTKDIVSSLTPPAKTFFVVPIESIYSLDSAVGRDRLRKLASSVSDVTGKEDLLDHLRLLCLQKAAVENGCTKIVMGTCASKIACHVLEETVKGKGFSLSADIQYADARWNVPVVLPSMTGSLKTVEAFQRPRAGINGLISSFVKLLKEENPSRESTILRTAGKLTPFAFNSIPEGGDNDALSSKRRQKKYNLKTDDSLATVSHCIICSSPLKPAEDSGSNNLHDSVATSGIFENTCSSCQHQTLPQDPSQLGNFVSLLPQAMATYTRASQQSLREQIQDLLLSDSDGGT